VRGRENVGNFFWKLASCVAEGIAHKSTSQFRAERYIEHMQLRETKAAADSAATRVRERIMYVVLGIGQSTRPFVNSVFLGRNPPIASKDSDVANRPAPYVLLYSTPLGTSLQRPSLVDQREVEFEMHAVGAPS